MEKKSNRNWRIILIWILILCFGAVIVGRLFFLQILTHKLFQAQTLGQQTGFSSITGARGQIYCTNSQYTKGETASGEVKNLAINKEEWTISALLNEVEDKDNFAEVLSKNIDISKEDMLSMFEGDEVSYVVIKKQVTKEKLEELKALNLKGLQWESSNQRYYPQGELAASILGFLGGEGSGQYGIEGYYEDILKGKSGIKEEKKGLSAIFSPEEELSLNGADIYLTIDYNIQFEAESLLKAAKQDLSIDSGQIIVIKPDTGKILALANFPSFDVNEYSKVLDMNTFQNGAVQKLFEPGSIMKPFTMAIALNEGKITPDTTYIDTGSLSFGTKTIHNFDNKVYGKQTMTQVLENSINTGAVFAEEQVSHKIYLDYLKKFGFTEKTNIDLQGEVFSRNEVLMNNAPDMNIATSSFGQGIDLNPMQIVRAFCALANGGKLVKPYIVEKIVNEMDEGYTKPELSRQIISKQTLSSLTKMLVSVIDNGFNKVAKIPGYYFAGKTGTAQVALANGKGYDKDKTIQSFIGFGPAYNPQFLILVKLDNPKVASSSLSAVPVFKKLAQYMISYWQIPPDYDIETSK
jgi:cell division protein FtsI (penicillin-binding protein 3)/stage V sporulation protein D (sporulation-specific penicillin-binding protein)